MAQRISEHIQNLTRPLDIEDCDSSLYAQSEEALEKLYDILIRPVDELLKEAKQGTHLVIVPFQAIALVPFAALRDRTCPKGEGYLIERFAISYSSSLCIMGHCKQRLDHLRTQPLGSALLVGISDFGGRFCNLPSAEQEAADVATLLASSNQTTDTLLGPKATPQRVLQYLKRAPLAHFATHGYVEKRHALSQTKCAVVLAQSDGTEPSNTRDHVRNRDAEVEAGGVPTGSSPRENRLKGDAWSDELREIRLEGSEDEREKSSGSQGGKEGVEPSEEQVTMCYNLTVQQDGSIKVEAYHMASTSDEEGGRHHPDSRKVAEYLSSEPHMDDPVRKLAPDELEKMTSLEKLVFNITWTVSHENKVSEASSEAMGAKGSRTSLSGSMSSELTYEDIIRSESRAELVVLSACNLAKGDLKVDGVMNVARAFMVAGTPCVVVAQWVVQDEYAKRLMHHFYSHMLQGLDVAKAMQRAMLELRKEHSDLSFLFWAPFVVAGMPTLRIAEPPPKQNSGS